MDTFGVNLEDLALTFLDNKSKGLFHEKFKYLFLFVRIAYKRPHTLDEVTYIPRKIPNIKTKKFQIYTYPDVENCIHEVIFNLNQKRIELKKNNTKPAKIYNFSLDSFQTRAILCIENGHSVLVSAHTSAGKTVVAEYAIAVSLSQRQRVIYTTPIKALSNQKFREFSEEFKDVGLMTGDITINPEASVLIMTTEILRSMLYRGSDVTREVGWVIFDEVHYMREKERGVVWEESMIMLPDKVNMVFLSATIPNAREFAQWIVSLHSNPCHVVYTDFRPTPLQHYVYPCGGDGIHLIVNQKGEFIESNFNSAMEIIRKSGDNAQSDTAHRGRKGGEINKEKSAVELIFNNAISNLSEVDRLLPQVQSILPLMKRGIGIHHGGLLPIIKEIIEILFSEGFIKVLFATETFAMGLNMPARTVLFTATRKYDGSTFRLLSPGEYIQMSGRAGRRGKDDRGTVILMVDNTLSPQAARQLLQGQPDPLNSAFHLTYTMVLNLLRVDDVDPEMMLQRSFYQFQNSLKLPQLERQITTLKNDLSALESSLPRIDIDESHIFAYLDLLSTQKHLIDNKMSLISKPKNLVPFLQPGRIIHVSQTNGLDFGWGVVLHVSHDNENLKCLDRSEALPYLVECLLEVNVSSLQSFEHSISKSAQQAPIPLALVEPADRSDLAYLDHDAEVLAPMDVNLIGNIKKIKSKQNVKSTKVCTSCVVKVVSVPLAFVVELTSVVLKLDSLSGSGVGGRLAKALRQTDEFRRQIWLGIEKAKHKLDNHLPLLDPIKDLKIGDPNLLKCLEEIALFDARIKANPLFGRPDLDNIADAYKNRIEKKVELNTAQKKLDCQQSLLQLDELIARKRVLRRLGFCSEDEVIQIKGRIACEISSGDELLLSELMLDGFFLEMQPPQIAGVLSCFVAESGTSKNKAHLEADMSKALLAIHDKARYLFRIASESRVSSAPQGLITNILLGKPGSSNESVDSEASYIERFSGELMEVVRAWANGVSFGQICEMTTVYEGSVIRCMRRLEELLRQMHMAAKVTGNTDLENKFLQAMGLIRRDIVFAASLYL